MPINCDQIKPLIRSSALVTACDPMGDGSLRLQTTFEYPGDEYVDLFVREAIPPNGPLRLTDASMTVAQLLAFGLDVDATPKRRRFVAELCRQLGVSRQGGELTIDVAEPIEANFGPSAVRLGQACVRVADLMLTYTERLNSSFDEELEEAFEALRLPVHPGKPLIGRAGRTIKVNYVVEAPRLSAAVFGLSARSAGNAKNRVNSTFRKWYELEPERPAYQFITLLDSRVPYWTDSDREVLADVSTVFDYPAEADAFSELLTTA